MNLQIGVRDDVFQEKNLSGQTYINLDNNFAARVALSYDPFGHSTDKFSMSYGRYFIPPASRFAFRGRELFTREFFLPAGGASTFTLGAGSVPLIGAPITSAAFTAANRSGTVCPPGTPAPGAAACILLSNGSTEPGISKSAVDLDTSYEDEFIIGYQKKLNNLWTVSANVTYRNLGTAFEDIAADTAINAYCARNRTATGCADAAGIASYFSGDAQYIIANPGRDTTIIVRPDAVNAAGARLALAGQQIRLSAADLGNPKIKREYYALELGFDRAFDGKWSLAGSYTLSKSAGNYEGTVKSDAGNGAQIDAGATQEFDHPGLQDGSYGLLPNHAAHQIKLYGSYMLLHNLSIGGNLRVQSPRHYGCEGFYPNGFAGLGGPQGGGAEGYGASSHYCNLGTVAAPQESLQPRGTSFEGDWYTQFDVQARYTVPKFNKFMPGNLVLRMDVFNLFDSSQVVVYDAVGESSAQTPSTTYKLPITYQAPRSVRFGFDWTF